MEFFGCEQGKGVLLPTDEGDGSFLVARGAKVSFYLPPMGMEFFGCRQGEGVSLPTAVGVMEFFGCEQGEGVSLPTTEGDGVFW